MAALNPTISIKKRWRRNGVVLVIALPTPRPVQTLWPALHKLGGGHEHTAPARMACRALRVATSTAARHRHTCTVRGASHHGRNWAAGRHLESIHSTPGAWGPYATCSHWRYTYHGASTDDDCFICESSCRGAATAFAVGTVRHRGFVLMLEKAEITSDTKMSQMDSLRNNTVVVLVS